MATAVILVLIGVVLVVWAGLAWARSSPRCMHSWYPWRTDRYDDPLTLSQRPFEWRSCAHCHHVQTRRV